MSEALHCPLVGGKCLTRDCAMYRGSQKQCGLAAPFPVLTKQVIHRSAINRMVNNIARISGMEVTGKDTKRWSEIITEELEREGVVI